MEQPVGGSKGMRHWVMMAIVMTLPATLVGLVAVYAAEAWLAYEVWEIEIGTGGRIERAARTAGANWDGREKAEVIATMRGEGKDTFPSFAPSVYWEDDGIPYQGGRILPFGGVSRSWAVFCNEMGPWMAYPTDEHGFNNPLGLQAPGKAEAVLVGDSFTHGACVPPGQDIASFMRDKGIPTVSLGIGGTGPLTYLAVQREFAKAIRPRTVFWIFYAVDIRDTVHEVRSPLMRRYLEYPGFSQNLASRQAEIDQFLRRFLDKEFEEKLAQLTAQRQERRRIITNRLIAEGKQLTRVRERLRNLGGRDVVTEGREAEKLGLLERILKLAKAEVEGWGGKLVFVYIPDWYTYGSKYDTYGIKVGANFLLRQDVLALVKTLGLATVDIQGEIFDKHKDPLSLYNWRTYGHYTPEGYRLIGERLAREARP